mgnify:CR=1 FL=1
MVGIFRKCCSIEADKENRSIFSFLYYKWFLDMRSNQQHVNSTIIKHNGSA